MSLPKAKYIHLVTACSFLIICPLSYFWGLFSEMMIMMMVTVFWFFFNYPTWQNKQLLTLGWSRPFKIKSHV